MKNSGASRRSLSRRTTTSFARWDANLTVQSGLWQQFSPPQLFVGSFLVLILLGTLGLMFLPGLYVQDGLTWYDALFTSTSAVCVTGLIVVDTATYFTFYGQLFVLLLIQLGGLGMLAFTSLVIQLLGFRLSLRAESLTLDARRTGPKVDLKRLSLDVFLFTVLIEAVGAVILWLIWIPRYGWTEAIWPAIFHSISAFCNAGFSTHTTSLIEHQDSSLTLCVIGLLVIAGGLGFVVMEELYLCWTTRKELRRHRVSVHTRLVLVTTLCLLVLPWPMFAVLEWRNELNGLSAGDKLVNSLFMSATSRTAGFNSIDYAAATDSTNFLTIILMTIGGSPGSTAGGLKTTTFALILLLAWSRFKGSETTVFANRSIPAETIQQAIGLAAVVVAVMTVGVFALSIGEQLHKTDNQFLAHAFEACSAFNTVGLSMNVTPTLSVPSRIVTILLMFLGRVGPLTLAAALVFRRRQRAHFRYAYEDVVVG